MKSGIKSGFNMKIFGINPITFRNRYLGLSDKFYYKVEQKIPSKVVSLSFLCKLDYGFNRQVRFQVFSQVLKKIHSQIRSEIERNSDEKSTK